MWEQLPSLESLEASLTDPSNPIGMRMRAAYYLKQLYVNNSSVDDSTLDKSSDNTSDGKNIAQEGVIRVLSLALLDRRQHSLMRHEVAYVMGQIKDDRSCSVLEQVLNDATDNVMVRHEAAEALGAIGAERSIIVLKSLADSSSGDNTTTGNPAELVETCQIALDVFEWRRHGSKLEEMPAACACMLNPYSSVDPAPPHPAHADMDIAELGDILCDNSLQLFERYRAMFSLRNRAAVITRLETMEKSLKPTTASITNTPKNAAVVQLCRALVHDNSSALLRHEVAYVLGQLQHKDSIEALEASLRRPNEHCMVRHESAEALGAIDCHERWNDIERILVEFSQKASDNGEDDNDDDDVIRESCLVALDGADYWGHNNSNNDLNDDDDDDRSGQGETDNSAAPAGSFSSQKNTKQPILANHFNIAA